MAEPPKWELKDPSHIHEDSSIMDVAMRLGAILFAGDALTIPGYFEKDNWKEPLTGNKTVLQDLLE